jgi:hypothetical protein
MTQTYRKGDEVHVKGVVKVEPFLSQDKMMAVVRIEPFNDIYVLVDHVDMVRPDFQVGDTVKWPVKTVDGSVEYTGGVLAIASEHLWVALGDGNFATVWVENASRVDVSVSPEDGVEAEPGSPELIGEIDEKTAETLEAMKPGQKVIRHVHTNINAGSSDPVDEVRRAIAGESPKGGA